VRIGYDMNGHGRSVPNRLAADLPPALSLAPQVPSLRQEAVEMRAKIVRDLFVQFELHRGSGSIDLDNSVERFDRLRRYRNFGDPLCVIHWKIPHDLKTSSGPYVLR
jgi:hypothetical protein